MLGTVDLTTYVIGVVVIVLLPGPNSLFVLSVAAQRGVRTGFTGACGVFVGDLVLMTLAATGAASLLKANPLVFDLVKYAGGGYLGWLGLGMWRTAARGWKLCHPTDAEPMPPLPCDRPFRRALSISLMNPKAILFFVSFFVQFVNPHYPHPALPFMLLGSILQFCSALYLTALIVMGTRLSQAFRRRRRLSASLKAGVGSLFLGFGAKLALARLS
jgi:leucine efflux protein